MKKFYAILGCALLALPVMADEPQLPNNGFEDGWHDCTPWTSNGNTKKIGYTPGEWTISQVIGISGTGKTTVGEKVAGYKSESAVKVYNSPNSTMPSQKVPGYVTLGTTWSTSVMGNQNDGGTFGGISFTGRPEKITFMYKFEKTSENTQHANAIVYLWKGTYTQADVPGNIVTGLFGSKPTNVNMVNRDRNILGMTTTKGGDVTKSEGAELIAEGKLVITETTSEWVKGEVVLDYKSDATPEMINVIFAANDYFSSENITEGNALTVDNVMCEYPVVPSEDNVLKYPGKLTVEMNGSPITDEPADATVQITPNESHTECTFLLPNLELPGLGNLGDIKVENVKMTYKDNETTFTGHVQQMLLAGGAIDATVDLAGTCNASGKLSMNIDVVWHSGDLMGEVPIKVTFNGQGPVISGVSDITADDANAPVEYYNLQGVRVNNPENGLYIVRQGKTVKKVLVK